MRWPQAKHPPSGGGMGGGKGQFKVDRVYMGFIGLTGFRQQGFRL